MIVNMKYTSGGPGSWNQENKTFALIDNNGLREERRYFWLDLGTSSFEPKEGLCSYDNARDYMFKKVSGLKVDEFNLENISLNAYLDRIKQTNSGKNVEAE